MAMHKGEIYRCPNEDCACEIEVLEGPQHTGGGGDESPRCCCGMAMKRTEGAEL